LKQSVTQETLFSFSAFRPLMIHFALTVFLVPFVSSLSSLADSGNAVGFKEINLDVSQDNESMPSPPPVSGDFSAKHSRGKPLVLPVTPENRYASNNTKQISADYKHFRQTCGPVINQFIAMRSQYKKNNNQLSLQQLAAAVQDLKLNWQHVKTKLSSNEQAFHSYQKVEDVMVTLQDAISYWQLRNQFQSERRGSISKQQSDRAVIQLKLQKAMFQIEQLENSRQSLQLIEKEVNEGVENEW
ncbi:MAG: hypothetical protein AAGI66_06840, partial [Cyanobacteria bacterium P01_H01_bin.74]